MWILSGSIFPMNSLLDMVWITVASTVKCPMWQFGVKMSLENVKKQLKAISRSVATGHPKIAIAELCGVLQALILEIEKIQNPKMTLLSTEQIPPIDTLQIPRIPKKRTKSPYEPSRIPRKRFNAGDAE